MYEFVSLLVQLFDHCLSLPIDVFMIFNVSATIRPQSWQLYGSFMAASLWLGIGLLGMTISFKKNHRSMILERNKKKEYIITIFNI